MMTESKLAFSSRNYSLLTIICELFRALIFPFVWQVVIIIKYIIIYISNLNI